MKKKIDFSLVSIKNKKIWFIGSAFCVLLVLTILILRPKYNVPVEARLISQDLVVKQKEIEKALREYLNAGEFTFSSPLIIQNPYGTAPLTALVIFDTPEKMQISIHTPGKTPEAAVDFTFSSFQTHHEIPVYGLYAGELNHVEITAKSENGEIVSKTVDLQTEPLPVYLENILINKVVRDKYSPGFNFTFLNHKTIFDIDGDIRWFSTEITYQVYTPLKNGHFLYTIQALEKESFLLIEQDLLGKIYAVYNIDGDVHHDIFELPNGNLLITGGDNQSQTVEDVLIEINRNTGHIIRFINMKKYLDENRPGEIKIDQNDWLHMNSVVYDEFDQSIIISSRTQSAVVKFSYPEMKIKWILGPHDNWSEDYQPFLLTPIGNNFEWSWSQHHANIYYDPNNSSINLADITLFDNGLYRSFERESAYTAMESYSRMVHYRINEELRTVEQIWEYGKEAGNSIFSHSQGSAYLLSNGNIMGTWSDIVKNANGEAIIGGDDENQIVATKVIEVNPASNEIIFETTLPDIRNYRTFRTSFYSEATQDKSNINHRFE